MLLYSNTLTEPDGIWDRQGNNMKRGQTMVQLLEQNGTKTESAPVTAKADSGLDVKKGSLENAKAIAGPKVKRAKTPLGRGVEALMTNAPMEVKTSGTKKTPKQGTKRTKG